VGRASPVATGQGSRLIRTPDPFQTRVAKLALLAAREHGFALGGGHALIAYGIVSRPTEDVDLFTDADDGVQPAAELVKRALVDAGMTIQVIPETSELGDLFYGFARDMVEFEVRQGEDAVRLQLVRFDRSRSPLTMEIGSVLHIDDVIGSKVAAMATRAKRRALRRPSYIDQESTQVSEPSLGTGVFVTRREGARILARSNRTRTETARCRAALAGAE